MKKIDYEKFITKETRVAIIPGTIKNIEKGAFWNKDLQKVILKEKIENIEPDAFRNNYLEEITIPSSIKNIASYAFYGNNLKQVILKEGLKKIDDFAFSDNLLKNVQFPASIKKIAYKAFIGNQLEFIEFKNGIENIGSYSFKENNLRSLNLPNSIKKIGIGAFEKNKLIDIELGKKIKEIENFTFSTNQLITIEIPGNIKKIGIKAFANNRIENITFNEGLEQISSCAFIDNHLKKVTLPNSVKKIENNAFDAIEIEYKNIKISKSMIEKFGTENIITIYNISKMVPFPIISKMPLSIMNTIPKDIDSIKGYYSNYKKFNNLINTIKEDYTDLFDTSFEYINIFKLCYVLGYFHHYSKDIDTFVNRIIKEKKIDCINKIMTSINLNKYDPKFTEVFTNFYNENYIMYNDTPVIDRVYNSFDKIKKYTLKRHEERIKKKNTEYKMANQQKKQKKALLLEQELNILKKKKKEISYEDICYYLENNIFNIKKQNVKLKQVVPELSIHINQSDFDKIQNIYEKSFNIEKSIPLPIDKRKEAITYSWLRSDNPQNTILGYVVNCCSKINDVGEDIMRQSIVNPNVINLVIYDELNQILGKTTAYHNTKENYILFNTIETKTIKNLGNKSAFIRKQESLLAILEAVKDIKEETNIKEVRIGMQRNDLSDIIQASNLVIEHKNLLDNYPWKGYGGDSNDFFAGQVILYNQDITMKDSMKKVKELNRKN